MLPSRLREGPGVGRELVLVGDTAEFYADGSVK